jgi:hypothetical protein
MSPRPPPWWRAPLTQWRHEIGSALLECWGRPQIHLVEQIVDPIQALEQLEQHRAVQLALRQVLGRRRQRWRLRSIKDRKIDNRGSPRDRKLLQPLIALVAFDDDLRPPHFTGRHKAQRHDAFDPLSVEQRRHVCAVGYLLLVAVLAFQSSKATAVDQEHQRAELVAEELLHASHWLYGKARMKLTISLVTAITGVKFSHSSIQLRARR